MLMHCIPFLGGTVMWRPSSLQRLGRPPMCSMSEDSCRPLMAAQSPSTTISCRQARQVGRQPLYTWPDMQSIRDTHALPELEGLLQPFPGFRGAMFSAVQWQAVQRPSLPGVYSNVAAAWLLSAPGPCLLADEQSSAGHSGNEVVCRSAGSGG